MIRAMRMFSRGLLICLLMPALSWPALAAEVCLPRWQADWVRKPPMAMPMLAAYGRLSNPCGQARRWVRVASPWFESVSLHESVQAQGVSRMREVGPPLVLPAHAEIALQPGGLHLMLMQPTRALRVGQPVPVTFEFDDGSRVETRLPLRETAP